MTKRRHLLVAFLALGLLTGPLLSSAEAGNRTKVYGSCSHCKKTVYCHYRVISYQGHQPLYGWVPSYHSACAAVYTNTWVRPGIGHGYAYGPSCPPGHWVGYRKPYYRPGFLANPPMNQPRPRSGFNIGIRVRR